MKVSKNDKNLGIGGTLNKLFELASGEFIMLHADDDVSYPEKIEKLLRYLLVDKSIIGVHSSLHEINLKGDLIGERVHIRLDREFSKENISYIINNINKLGIVTQSHIFRRSVIDKFGGFDENCSHESNVMLFREALIGRIIYVKEALTQYRIGSGTSTVSIKNDISLIISESIKINNWHFYATKNILNDLSKIKYEINYFYYLYLKMLCIYQHSKYWRKFQILNNRSILFSLIGFVLIDSTSISASFKTFFPNTFLLTRKVLYRRFTEIKKS